MNIIKYCLWALLLVTLSACQSLPKTPHLAKSLELTARSQALQPPYSTPAPLSNELLGDDVFLSQTFAQSQSTPELSGYRLIASGADAFALRVQLTALAKKTIDVQYYIWHDDLTGVFMLKQLWAAAERGVIVRLLLDDFNSTPQSDYLLAKLASHPNIAVRLANPMVYRKFRPLNFIQHPYKAQIRMHNKSMTFDGKVSIIGGRNIGDEYLNSHENNNFADLDVLMSGSVIGDIERTFNDYWHSNHVFDIETLANPKAPKHNKHKDVDFGRISALEQTIYERATRSASIIKNSTVLRQAHVSFFTDNAIKLSNKHSDDDLLITHLKEYVGQPMNRLSIISSYFVPTKDGVALLTNLARQGVSISILTNAYNASDVSSVHLGYGHWRDELLKAGIVLYEFKDTARHPKAPNPTTTSLHTKAFAIDDDLTFIGSYNVDPRSANINSELGVVIDDPFLTEHLHKALNNNHSTTNSHATVTNPNLLYQAYKVELDNRGNLYWQTLENGKTVIYHHEPKIGLGIRTRITLLSLLPIDSFL